MMLFFAFLSRAAHEGNRVTSWPVCTIVFLVFMFLSKGEISILPAPGNVCVWGGDLH